LRALNVDLFAKDLPANTISYIPRYSRPDLNLLPNVSIIYFDSSCRQLDLSFDFLLRPTTTVRTLVFSEFVFDFLSKPPPGPTKIATRRFLSWVNQLGELENAVRVCKGPHDAHRAKEAYRWGPTALEKAIRDVLGHDMRIVSLEMNTLDGARVGHSWKSELVF
jgi:hypothetical protein